MTARRPLLPGAASSAFLPGRTGDNDMAKEKRPAKRGASKKKRRAKRGPYEPGQRKGSAKEDRLLGEIERENRRFVAAMEALQGDAAADVDKPLLAAREFWAEAPDLARLQSRFLARSYARLELEDWSARAFLSGVLSAVVCALHAVAADPSDQGQPWFDAQDRARSLREQLLAFCATRGISPTEWPKGSRFIDLLSDLDKAAMIERLTDSGVGGGKYKYKLLQRDACAVVGVNEDYISNVRRRHKTLSK